MTASDERKALTPPLPPWPDIVKRYEPWPGDPPEGWPYEYVAAVNYDAALARLRVAVEALKHYENSSVRVKLLTTDQYVPIARYALSRIGPLPTQEGNTK